MWTQRPEVAMAVSRMQRAPCRRRNVETGEACPEPTVAVRLSERPQETVLVGFAPRPPILVRCLRCGESWTE